MEKTGHCKYCNKTLKLGEQKTFHSIGNIFCSEECQANHEIDFGYDNDSIGVQDNYPNDFNDAEQYGHGQF